MQVGKIIKIGFLQALVLLMLYISQGRGTGAYLRNPANLGEGLGRLTNREVKISQKGFDSVSKHLAQFGPVEENELMLKRLEYVLKNSLPLTAADASFYIQEVTEATNPAKLKRYASAQIRRLRERHHVSQWNFAAYLNSAVTTVRSWEGGKHKSSGSALVLLNSFYVTASLI